MHDSFPNLQDISITATVESFSMWRKFSHFIHHETKIFRISRRLDRKNSNQWTLRRRKREISRKLTAFRGIRCHLLDSQFTIKFLDLSLLLKSQKQDENIILRLHRSQLLTHTQFMYLSTPCKIIIIETCSVHFINSILMNCLLVERVIFMIKICVV